MVDRLAGAISGARIPGQVTQAECHAQVPVCDAQWRALFAELLFRLYKQPVVEAHWQASGHQCVGLVVCDGILCVRRFKGPAPASFCGQRDALSQAGAGHLRSPECIESQASRVGAAGRPGNGGYERRRSQEDCPCGRRRASGGAVAQSTVSSGAQRCKPTSIGSHATSGNKLRPCVLGASERSGRPPKTVRPFKASGKKPSFSCNKTRTIAQEDTCEIHTRGQ